jgi:hypothetical protein
MNIPGITMSKQTDQNSAGSKTHAALWSVVFIYGAAGSGSYSVVLTPRQTMHLCGWPSGNESSCFSSELLKPPWVKEELRGTP